MKPIKLWKAIEMDVDAIKSDPENPNEMTPAQFESLGLSFETFGFTDPIIIDQKGLIANGEWRLKKAKELGMKKVPVVKMQLTEAERRLLRQTFNKVHGEHDKEKDAGDALYLYQNKMLEQLAKMTAIDSQHYKSLLERYHDIEFAPQDTTDPNSLHVTERKENARTKPGDIWQMGPHRLICGDNQDPANYRKLLLEAEAVAQLNCDPPYGVDYDTKNEMLNLYDRGNRIQTPMLADQAKRNLRAEITLIFNSSPWAQHNTIYIFSAGFKLHDIRLGMEDAGITWSDYLVWVKNNHVLGRKDYNQKREFVIYGWKGQHIFYGPFRTNVLEYDKPLINDLHPTMKPVPLVAQLITDGSKPGDVILDPYAGSGTSLIACEELARTTALIVTNDSARKWRGMEIDPYYCDVIVTRWEKLTGRKAELAKVDAITPTLPGS